MWWGGVLGACFCAVSGPAVPDPCLGEVRAARPLFSSSMAAFLQFPSSATPSLDPHILALPLARCLATLHSDQFNCSFHSFVARQSSFFSPIYAFAFFLSRPFFFPPSLLVVFSILIATPFRRSTEIDRLLSRRAISSTKCLTVGIPKTARPRSTVPYTRQPGSCTPRPAIFRQAALYTKQKKTLVLSTGPCRSATSKISSNMHKFLSMALVAVFSMNSVGVLASDNSPFIVRCPVVPDTWVGVIQRLTISCREVASTKRKVFCSQRLAVPMLMIVPACARMQNTLTPSAAAQPTNQVPPQTKSEKP